MTYSPADWMRYCLIANAVGVHPILTPAGLWPIYVDGLPDGPGFKDNAIAVYNTLERTDGRIHKTGKTITHPGMQFRVRATNSPDAYAKILQIANLIDLINRAQVNIGTDATIIAAVTRKGINRLGPDPGNRDRSSFTLNAFATFV